VGGEKEKRGGKPFRAVSKGRGNFHYLPPWGGDEKRLFWGEKPVRILRGEKKKILPVSEKGEEKRPNSSTKGAYLKKKEEGEKTQVDEEGKETVRGERRMPSPRSLDPR